MGVDEYDLRYIKNALKLKKKKPKRKRKMLTQETDYVNQPNKTKSVEVKKDEKKKKTCNAAEDNRSKSRKSGMP